MGFFDSISNGVNWLGSKISDGAKYIGQKAAEGAQYLGDKVSSALPIVGDIAAGINKYAPMIADVSDSFGIPVAGGVLRGLGKGAGYVSDYVKSGSAQNNLEAARKGLNGVSNIANNVTKNLSNGGLGSK